MTWQSHIKNCTVVRLQKAIHVMRLNCTTIIAGFQVESPEVKYDTSVPVLKSLYIWGHYILILFVWHPYLAKNKEVREEMILVVTLENWNFECKNKEADKLCSN